MGYKRTETCQPSPSDLRRFRTILLAKQRQILGNVTAMEDEALRRSHASPSSASDELADLGTDTYELDNTLSLVGSERGILAEIEGALARIQSGTYGICEGDGQPIGRARLRAIPWTRFCVRCASLRERGVLSRNADLDDEYQKVHPRD